MPDFSSIYPKNWTLTINDVLCGIYLGESGGQGYGITESYSNSDGRRATVWFQCYWVDRLDLIAGLLGTVEYIGGTIIRNDPFVYPLTDRDAAAGIFSNRLFCTGILGVQGSHPWTDTDGTDTGLPNWIGYAYALVQAEFTSPPYLIEPLFGPGVMPPDPSFNDLSFQTYCVSDIKISPEVFAPPTGAFVFAGGAAAGKSLLDVGASQIRVRDEITITRLRMPLIPMGTAGPLFGTVNLFPMQIAGNSFPTGSTLFNGLRPVPRSDPYNGGIIWDVDMCWLANSPANNADVPLDWNYFMDPAGAWNAVETSVGGDPVFAYADHSVLFDDAIT